MPPSPWNELENHAGCFLAERRFESSNIVARHEPGAWQEGFEVLPVFRLPCNRNRAQSPAVKGVFERNDFGLAPANTVAVRANHLQGCFHRLRAGIAEETPFETARSGKSFGKLP